ncbi:MAG: 4Fe-4S binding protein [Eggerthellaceae bacterium]
MPGLHEELPHGRAHDRRRKRQPAYDARYCIGCGICVDTCPTHSIDLVEANLADMLPQGPGRPPSNRPSHRRDA